MPSKKTKKILFIWTIVTIAIASVFAFMLWTILASDKVYISKSLEIKEEIKKADSFLFIKKDVETNKDSINKIYDYIIKPEEVVNFMQKIEDLAKNNSLKSEVKSVSFEAIADTTLSNLESMKIQVSVSGDWKNVAYFLELLENYPASLNIKKVSLNNNAHVLVKNKKVSQWTGVFDFSVIKIKDK